MIAERELIHEAKVWTPRSNLGLSIAKALPLLRTIDPGLAHELLERLQSAVIAESELRLTIHRGLGLAKKGLMPFAEVVHEDYGLVSTKVVTNTGAGFIIDALQNLTEAENMKFHALGTGSVAEAAADSALGTELTTEYTGNVRATGTNAEISQQIYQSVGTNTLDSGAPVLREHGLMSASSAGVLFDRSVFAALTLDGVAGDALTTDYRWTLNSGG